MKNPYKPRFHWIIAILVFWEMIIVGGLINSANVFIIPVTQDFGVSRAAFGSANIPYNLVCTISTLFTGAIFRRFGYKIPAILSLLLIGASMVVTGLSDSLVMYGFGRALFGLGFGVCFTAGATFLIRNWFLRHQGLVLGAVSMASGFGGSFMTALLTWLTDSYSWRIASLAAAALCVVTAVLYFLLRDHPEQKGLRPLGFGAADSNGKHQAGNRQLSPGPTFAELVKTPSFYVLTLCVLLFCSCTYIASTTVVPHFQSIGYPSGVAAAYQSALMLTLASAKLICGGLCDRFGAKPVSLACVLCAVAGEGILGLTADPFLCIVGTVLLAVGVCMTSVLIPLLAQELFGYRAALSVNGVLLALACVANILASVLSGMCFDHTGSYVPGYLAAAAANAVIAGMLFLLFYINNKNQPSA